MLKLNKILTISMSALLALLLVGCGGSSNDGTTSNNNSNPDITDNGGDNGGDGEDLVSTASTALVAYSSQLSSSSEITDCARVLIPKKSATRALRMLEDQGLFQLQDNGGELSPQDIVGNAFNLDVIVYEPLQMSSVIADQHVAIFIVDPMVTHSTIPVPQLFVEETEEG